MTANVSSRRPQPRSSMRSASQKVQRSGSGATWAPAYVAYGGNNRTQLMRVPEAGRIELRAVDGAANPYLAFAAVLAAGLDGIDRRADPDHHRRGP